MLNFQLKNNFSTASQKVSIIGGHSKKRDVSFRNETLFHIQHVKIRPNMIDSLLWEFFTK